MAILTKYARYNGEIPKFLGFNNDKYIIDGKVLDNNFVQINKDNVDIIGNKFELSADQHWINYYNTSKGHSSYSDGYSGYSFSHDSSTDNPVFCGVAFSKPDMNDANYVLTNRVTSSHTGMYLSRLADDGTVITNVAITLANARIVDCDNDYLYVIGYQATDSAGTVAAGNRYSAIRAYDLKTLSLKKSANFTQYGANVPNVIYRTQTRLCLLNRITGVPTYFNKSASNISFTNYARSGDSPSSPAIYAYNATIVSNHTTPLENGWIYGISRNSSDWGKYLPLEGYTFNHDASTYKYCDPATMQLDIDEEKCDMSAVTLTKFSGTSTNTSLTDGCYRSFKLTEKKFVVFGTVLIANKNVTGLNWKSRYIVCEIDDDDPTLIHIRNAQFLPYTYTEEPMRYDSNKFMFVNHLVASHGYTFNDEANEFDLTWNINTPNIVSSCFYNGMYWWFNKSTYELNYEIEGNVLRIESSFDDTEVQLISTSDPIETTYRISVYDGDNNRVSTSVKLTCKGVITFVDGSTEKTIKTSTSGDHVMNVKVLNAGESFIVSTLLQ